jgi:chromosome segregation ATPase
MDPIPHEKKLEVCRYYICGLTYAAIEKNTGVSHGTVVNCIKELEAGHLVIPGVAADEVQDLHQLSIDLAKKNLEPSKALLGIALFEKFTEKGIDLSKVEYWAKLVDVFSPANFPAKGFFEAALRLHQLEVTEGKSFEVLADEYAGMKQQSVNLKIEVDSLTQQRDDLNGKIKSLTPELITLENKKIDINKSIELQSQKLKEANDKVDAAHKILNQTEKDVEILKKQKIKLGVEVNGKEKALKRLQELNFSEEDLLRLRNTVERMAKKGGISPEQVKDQFFSALNRFGDFTGLEEATQKESKTLREIRKQKSLLTGEIIDLESRKEVLNSEVSSAAAAGVEQIGVASKETVSAIRQEADAIKKELKALLEDTMVAGLAVGEMKVLQNNGEESGKEFEKVVNEVKLRIGKSR